MDKNEHNPQMKEVDDTIKVHNDHQPYWKTIHHTWSFWIILLLMLAGILYYIVSVDFMFAPRQQEKQPYENMKTR